MKVFRWLLYFATLSLPGIVPCSVLANEILNFDNFIPAEAELNDALLLENSIQLDPFVVENIADFSTIKVDQEPWQTSANSSHNLTYSTSSTKDLRSQVAHLEQPFTQALTEPTKEKEPTFSPAITPENSSYPESIIQQLTDTENSEQLSPSPTVNTVQNDGWQVFITPGAVLPINAYGSARISGVQGDYHLTTADILERLTVYAGGRVEAWHGNWGIILDGFYYNLKGASTSQRDNFPGLASFSPINYLLNTDINNRLNGINGILADQSGILQQKKSDINQNLAQIQSEFEEVRNAAPDRQDLMTAIASASAKIETLQALGNDIDRQAIGAWAKQINELKKMVEEGNLGEREIEQKLTQLQIALGTIQGFRDSAIGSIDRLENRVQQRVTEIQTFASQLQNLREETRQLLATLPLEEIDRRDLAKIALGGLDKIKQIEGDQNHSTLENIIDRVETAQDRLEAVRTLQTEIQSRIANLRSREDLEALQKKLAETRERVGQVREAIANLEEIKDSHLGEIIQILQDSNAKENLVQLQNALTTLQSLKNNANFADTLQDLAKLDQILANEEEVIAAIQAELYGAGQRDLSIDTNTDLSVSETTVDLAISYHFGNARPVYGSGSQNRSYPQWWFEPYIGARLINLSLALDQTTNYNYNSSLISLGGQFQINETASRTWINPLVGGKLGVQLTDTLALWLRGDVSGFDLSGDADWNWKAILGMDYYVRENVAIQLGYQFYSLKYGQGNGNNGFDFSLNLNGPYVGLTLRL
ncbi:hypothetical protein [Synechocystis sp. PCC 7338]|uniref:hypothetical protein n=1 Tax=Synechocystis sp. PCC 7338 TaxID=2732530 RepID=UPI001BAF9E3D|nr:hypothetical protein [Synechocystis sp. PCC 7338]QUS60282.1 hypothetical protein HTZ78_06070 [Synechocystis sp. PCC 7338]